MNRKEELEAELDKIVKRLKKDRDVRLILLFGSLARGEAGKDSDLDLIIVRETDRRFLDRLDEFYEGARISMDILVYTPEEFNYLREGSFIRSAVEEGVILYEG